MMNEIINNYGYVGIGTIGILGLIIIRSLFKKNNKAGNKDYIKYGITKEQFERLTEYEQKRKPDISRKKAEKWALNRIERDRR